MKTGIAAAVFTLAAALTLAACRDTSELEAQALASQKARCAAQGKQFLWNDTDTDSDPLTVRVRVEGRCVGPRERGYLPPEPPDNDP